MKLTDSPEEAEWRAEVRSFLEKELPPTLKRRGMVIFAEAGGGQENPSGAVSTESRAGGTGFKLEGGPMGEWRQKLGERGWIAPPWPQEDGGAGLSPLEQVIIDEEVAETG